MAIHVALSTRDDQTPNPSTAPPRGARAATPARGRPALRTCLHHVRRAARTWVNACLRALCFASVSGFQLFTPRPFVSRALITTCLHVACISR
eukprot:2236844-Prymnesium_polylepis.1